MEMMDPYEYVKLELELVGYAAKRLYTPGDPALEDPEDPENDDYIPGGRTLEDYIGAPYNNWQSLLYRTAPVQNYSLSVSGGSNNNNYMISGSVTDQEGTIIKTGFKRYQGRFVFNQDINKKTRLNLNVNYANTATEGSSPSVYPSGASVSYNLLYAIWGYRPAISPNSSLEDQLNSGIDPDGQLDYAYNPYVSAQNTDISSDSHNLAANAYIDYKITKDLVFRIRGGVTYNHRLGKEYYGVNTSRGMAGSLMGPNGKITNSASTSLLNENTLSYKKVINQDHYLNLLAGFSVQRTRTNSSSAQASQVPNDALGVSGLDEGTPYNIGSASSNNFLSSYFGRVNYNYQSKYFLTGVLRADGSSKFAPGNRWGYFPSGAIAWDIAKESFMKPAINFLSELKFRGSYGISGNNRIGNFEYLSAISLDNSYSYPFENVYEAGAVQSSLANSALKWETTATTDIGLDVSLWKDRISLVVDYYKKVTDDLLLQATTPGYIGYTSAMKNIGKVQNTGWEFTLNTLNVTTKKFNWDSNFNISFNRNKVMELTSGQRGMITSVYFDTNPLYPYLAEVGGPVSQIIGYKWLGNYQYEDFDLLPNGTYVLKGNLPDNGLRSRTAIQPGDIKYQDINGDGTVNDADRMVIGDPNPLFTGGFSNNFTYRGFDLNVVLTFSYGNDIVNANRIYFEGFPKAYLNQFATYINRWTPENQTNEYPRAGGISPDATVTSRVVEDGSFLRLKTVSLGYKLPSALLQKVQIKQARIYCSAQNLAVWTDYKGSDPEVSTRSGGLVQGFDFSSYPRSFSLTFGFNLTF
jgi:TonB-linked SusC/RagA family outer membrane protein